MNGAVYIPFFQGQLESVLEQVVQLAVHEISSTVGSSLNALLLEAAAQEQENRRLRLRLQAWESHHGHNKGGAEEYRESQAAAAGDDGSDGVRKKPEQPAKPRGPTDSRRLEQRGRVVGRWQLKSVMERVLHSALCQLKKMVEASFDDLLLEITQKECERQTLQARLDCKRGAARREARDNPGSPGGSEAAPKDTCPEPAEETGGTGGTEDKANAVVFGHEWCGDIWKPKGSVGGGGASGRGSSEGPDPPLLPAMALTLEKLINDQVHLIVGAKIVLTIQISFIGLTMACFLQTGSWGIHSSASMLQRLLTASQLPDDNAGTTHKKPQDARVMPTGQGTKQQQEEEEQEEEEEEDKHDQGEEEEEEEEKGRKKRRKVWSECEDCGRRFSRVLLLKAHRQIHADANVGVTSSRCSLCGKRFPSAGRLRSHLQAKHRS
uniref:Uncharacterized LOC109513741 n=1 Tax=Hippocampus comes TaxID=109280 RepID=A0A3Q3D2R5_HIPCM